MVARNAPLVVISVIGGIAVGFCQFSRRSVRQASATDASSQAVARAARQLPFSAYAAGAPLQRKHVGAIAIGIVESFAVRHSRGSSLSLIQCFLVQASVDIEP
jgi:hypothetical protein